MGRGRGRGRGRRRGGRERGGGPNRIYTKCLRSCFLKLGNYGFAILFLGRSHRHYLIASSMQIHCFSIKFQTSFGSCRSACVASTNIHLTGAWMNRYISILNHGWESCCMNLYSVPWLHGVSVAPSPQVTQLVKICYSTVQCSSAQICMYRQ